MVWLSDDEKIMKMQLFVFESCPGFAQPHTAHPIAKTASERSHTDFVDQCI